MPGEDLSATVAALVDAEIEALDLSNRADRLLLESFRQVRVRKSRPITVQFSGGIWQTCWSVTRSNGAYSVFYLPSAGYFSLCVDSDFGPLDIGVHGPALAVFAAV